jgi:hypothetical protein
MIDIKKLAYLGYCIQEMLDIEQERRKIDKEWLDRQPAGEAKQQKTLE